MTYFVYMTTNRSRVVLYIGVTNNLERRVSQHQRKEIKGFTRTYKVDRLVYYESYNDPRDAIAREKEIKGWRREKKNARSYGHSIRSGKTWVKGYSSIVDEVPLPQWRDRG